MSVTSATNNVNLLVAAGPPTISYVALNAGLTPDVLGTPSLAALGNAFSTTFTTNFQTRIDALGFRFQTQGHAANRARVLRHVFTDASVTTRHTTHQQTVFILK